MRPGTPVIVSPSAERPLVAALAPISTRRDDPNGFTEEFLQHLIDECPSVLPVRDFFASVSTLFSLACEVPVDIGGATGYVDNLLVTDDGHLVIVETKLYRNPEAARDVVTQTLQYGMGVGRMRVQDLEAAIRSGQGSKLQPGETIADCVARLASTVDGGADLADDWEDALEKHLRSGEILMLVVSDAIRVAVERVGQWISEQGSSAPFTFGLVELKAYAFGDQRVVVPRSLLKTREVSRHVVIVDIQPAIDVRAEARVIDETQTATGGKQQSVRPVKTAGVPRTKATILELISPESHAATARVIEALESLGFETEGTPATLKVGFHSDDGTFRPLIAFDWCGVWQSLLKRDRELLGEEEVLAFKRGMNEFGPFFPADTLDRPTTSDARSAKAAQLVRVLPEFGAFLDSYRTKILEALRAEQLA